MSNCVNTVTISLDDYRILKAKEKAIESIESDPDTFIIYQVDQYNYFSWKRFSSHSTGVIEALQLKNKSLQDELEALKKQHQSDRSELITLRAKHHYKKWYQFWE